jgi:hypothetical protein
MGLFNREPARNTSLDALDPDYRPYIVKLLEYMRARGQDPTLFETVRTEARQKWLYGVGRTHSKQRKPVTWTLKSRHLPNRRGYSEATDIISRKNGWGSDEFYDVMEAGIKAIGHMKQIPKERCHVQYVR